jgi:uncharacterized protein
MPHRHTELVEVRETKNKGRGVFAREFIPEGTVIERVPVLLVTWDHIDHSELVDYAFAWSPKKVAIALGYGSLYNHSYTPNARYDDIGRKTKVFSAIRDIEPGEEITVNYNGEPDDRSELDFTIADE